MTAAVKVTSIVDWTVQAPKGAKFTQHTAYVNGFVLRVREWHGSDRNHWTVALPAGDVVITVARGVSVEIHGAMMAAVRCAENGGKK
ncbi:MAG: hypothetical protein H3C62_16795 [Gemmatimonadaceae bacterium]|nr:hypothetical protein [Gemmatimonadaceae bacterium]